MAGYSSFEGLLNDRATGLAALGYQTYSDQMGLRADTARAVGLCAKKASPTTKAFCICEEI